MVKTLIVLFMAHLIFSLSFLFFAPICCDDIFLLYPPSIRSPPSTSLIFSIGDTINTKWQNSSNNPRLTIWCRQEDGGFAALYNTTVNSFKPSGCYLIPLTFSFEDANYQCHMELFPPGVNSVGFEIKASEDRSTPITWGLDQAQGGTSSTSSIASRTDISTVSSAISATASLTAIATTTSTATSADKTTSRAAPAPDSVSSGLSTGAKVAIGLGVALAFVLGASGISFVTIVKNQRASAESKRASYARRDGAELPG